MLHFRNFFFLSALLLIFFIIDIAFGSVRIPFLAVCEVLFYTKTTTNESWQIIIQEYRLPKAITAILAGIGLSVSGLQMQTLFRNPIASPDLLGISAGASFGVAIIIFLKDSLPNLFWLQGQWLLVFAAIAGAALVLILLLLVAKQVPATTLLIIGFMLTAIFGSLINLFQYFSRPETLQQYLIWSYGSLGSVSWQQMPYLCSSVFFGLFLAFWVQKSLNTLLLGESYAQSMGVNITRTKTIIIISLAFLAGGITAFCGFISFLAVAVPHFAFYIFKTSNQRLLLPATALLGSICLLLCDILCNLVSVTYVLPINIVTSLLGSPILIFIYLRK